MATFSAKARCKSSTGCTFFTAHFIASIIVSSGISFIPASTIITLPSLQATTRSIGEVSLSSGDKNPLNSPSICPIRIPATGPSNGKPAFIRALEAAIIATQSGLNDGSIESTVQTTCTSWRYPLGNSGRIGRSIKRPTNTASSAGFPSLLIKREPEILPAAYHFSS